MAPSTSPKSPTGKCHLLKPFASEFIALSESLLSGLDTTLFVTMHYLLQKHKHHLYFPVGVELRFPVHVLSVYSRVRRPPLPAQDNSSRVPIGERKRSYRLTGIDPCHGQGHRLACDFPGVPGPIPVPTPHLLLPSLLFQYYPP